jgi:hypothetical protein
MTVKRVRLRSTMWVPPCDAGVYPIPASPVSRPECSRISTMSAIEISTWKTARKETKARPGYQRADQSGRTSTIASISSAAMRSFVTYPTAPAFRARSTSLREFEPVSMRMRAVGSSLRISRVA